MFPATVPSRSVLSQDDLSGLLALWAEHAHVDARIEFAVVGDYRAEIDPDRPVGAIFTTRTRIEWTAHWAGQTVTRSSGNSLDASRVVVLELAAITRRRTSTATE